MGADYCEQGYCDLGVGLQGLRSMMIVSVIGQDFFHEHGVCSFGILVVK
jgi:hypothetical protein